MHTEIIITTKYQQYVLQVDTIYQVMKYKSLCDYLIINTLLGQQNNCTHLVNVRIDNFYYIKIILLHKYSNYLGYNNGIGPLFNNLCNKEFIVIMNKDIHES